MIVHSKEDAGKKSIIGQTITHPDPLPVFWGIFDFKREGENNERDFHSPSISKRKGWGMSSLNGSTNNDRTNNIT